MTATRADTDTEAMRRCQQGEASALDGLVERHQLAAVRIAYVLVQDPFIAEDIVQESFLLVYRKCHLFRDGERFAPWFHQIVLNTARQHLRTMKRHPEQSLDHQFDLNLFRTSRIPLTHIAHNVVEPDPSAHMEHVELRRAVLDIIGSLTMKQREVLVLRYYCDYTDKEITHILAVPSGTVRWRLHAALRAFERTMRRSHPWLVDQEQASRVPPVPQISSELREGARHS